MSTNTENLSKTIDDLKIIVSHFANTAKPETIEIDIALAKTREIYELLLKLHDIKKFPVSKPEPDSIKESVKTTVEKQVEVQEVKSPVVDKKTEEIIELEPDQESETLQKQEETVTEVTNIVHQEVKTEVRTKTHESDTIAEKFKKNEPLINEFLARQGKRDLSSVLQAKPVKSIESAIGINERFEFVRELFNGDNATYIKTIRVLDNSASFNDAFNYINQTFSWDFESETVHKLLDLVRRRYITD